MTHGSARNQYFAGRSNVNRAGPNGVETLSHPGPVANRVQGVPEPGAFEGRVKVCGRGHSMADAYVRPGGGLDCRPCRLARSRKRCEAIKAARIRPTERSCVVCYGTYLPARMDHRKYCGRKCQMIAYFDRRDAKLAKETDL